MKLPLSCHECIKSNTQGLGSVAWVEFRDDSRYEFTCSHNHKTVAILQEQKFEVLFEIGAFAIKDGYYREAVSSFSSSLERFYEFVATILLLKQKIDIITIKKAWKLVSSQSERQLGAYIFLYLSEFGEAPVLLNQKRITFRNAVIHKGKIPNKDEAINYGQSILDICRPIIAILKESYKDEITKAVLYHLRESRTEDDNDKSIGTIGMPSILSLTNGEPALEKQSLQSAILKLRKR